MSELQGRRGVVTQMPSYIAAAAELQVSAAVTTVVSGAVVVVPGSTDWWQGMHAARAGGALAVVIADPWVLPRDVLEVDPWPGGIPVIVERPRLRPDVVADALRARGSSPARIITVECAAPAAGFVAAIRDGFGWARSFVQESLTLRAGSATSQCRIALLDSDGFGGGPVPVTVAATVAAGGGAEGLLQVLALGEVRSEVTLDQPAGLTRVETSSGDGAVRSPQRYESSARLALRRAVEACAAGGEVSDLDELLEDMTLTWSLLDL
ncbi:MAG: hypothetical protein ABWY04_03185 [Arthrobacter sp.]